MASEATYMTIYSSKNVPKKVSRLANAIVTSFTSEPFWKPKSTLS